MRFSRTEFWRRTVDAESENCLEDKSAMDDKRWKASKMVMVVLVWAAVSTGPTAATQSTGLCEEFRKLSASGGGLIRYILEGFNDDSPANLGKKLIPNIDIDGDDVSDELLWLPQESGSLTPSDYSNMVITLSKSGKQIRFEALRFFLFRYRSKIFIEASRPENIEETSIYRINSAGIEVVCKKL